tara:strand:- start:2117 stop:2860 length:744 start_codon:yes stop_codon:yes gene_type:complete
MGRRLITHATPPTWEELDENIRQEFLQGGEIEKVDYFLNQESNTNTFYPKEQMDAYLAAVKDRKTNYYGITDYWLYNALDKHSITKKDVAILGSLQPWYEAICLSFGGVPYTIEYNKLETDDSRLNLTTVEEYNSSPRSFDAAFSISSFEHDGLGRYGDPINPNGDMLAMKHTRENVLRPGGLLFLGVPCGKDKLSFNAHRIYGKKRFYKLIEGYELVDTYPTNFEEMLEIDTGRSAPQPIVVLKVK